MDLLSYAEVAEIEHLPVTRVAQQVREGQMVSLKVEGANRVPALFLQDGQVVKHLPAVVTLLRDGGFRDEEIVDWLFRQDPTLPGAPIDALRENRGTEIKRRAQASAL